MIICLVFNDITIQLKIVDEKLLWVNKVNS